MDQNSIKLTEFIQHNGLSVANHGLMHGNTGISIYFYHLSRNTNNPAFEQIADDLLDKVFTNFSSAAPANFENGLAGIGWGIEYLVQHNFAEGNTDEILEEVDNKIFRALNEENHSSFELANGLTGYLWYLTSRLKNKTNSASMAQRINCELLIRTINMLDEMVTNQFRSVVKDLQFDLYWRFPMLFYGLAEAFGLNVYNEKIRCMIKQWLPYFEAYIPSLHINRLFLAISLKRICSLVPNKRLEKQGQNLLFATDFEILKTEIDHGLLNIRFGWPGTAWILYMASKEIPDDWPNYHLISKAYREIMERHKDPMENFTIENQQANGIQYGLSLGLAGIGLLEIIWPGILSGNFSNEMSGDD